MAKVVLPLGQAWECEEEEPGLELERGLVGVLSEEIPSGPGDGDTEDVPPGLAGELEEPGSMTEVD